MKAFGLCAAACLLAACASQPSRDPGAATPSSHKTSLGFIVVRHAEKSDDDPRDPSLSEVGEARAQRLAKRMAEHDLIAAYATGYRRTQQTAQPTALLHGLDVQTYDASQAAAMFASELRQAHRHGTVLVVGHSNTVPAIAGALCACPVAAMDEDEYGRMYEIAIDSEGRATLHATTQP